VTQLTSLKQVNVDAIRSELHSLWASEALADQSTTIRAQTHNLIVYTEDESDVERLIDRIVQLTSDRPGRVIVVDGHPTSDSVLDAWVTAYCREVNQKQVCAELVMIRASGKLRDGIHSTIISMLAADLPVYLWWMALPDETDPLFKQLADEADRIIVDTGYLKSEQALFDRLVSLSSKYRVSDLNWSRLTPWRRWLAQLWDVRALRDVLTQITSLDIHYVTDGDFENAARSLLLVGWLAERFDWHLTNVKVGKTGGYTTYWHRFDEFGWDGKVELVESRDNVLGPGELVGIFIQAGDEPPYVMPRIQVDSDRGVAEIRFDDTTPGTARREVVFRPVGTAAALAEELDLGYDPFYKRALVRTAEIMRMVTNTDQK